MGLSQFEINSLARKIAQQINAATEAELVSGKADEILLGAVVNKDALLNPEIAEIQRVVPEDVDS